MNEAVYLANNTIVGPEDAAPAETAEAAAPTETVTEVPATPEQPQTSPGLLSIFNPNTQLLLTMIAVFALMYFFTIRPQRKRERELREIQSSIKTGDWIVTFSGMFGKVVDVGTDVVMVEFGSNKTVRVPVRKTEMTKTTEPTFISKKDDAEADKKDKKAD